MKNILELRAEAAPVDKHRARELFNDGERTFYNKVKGIKEQIEKGRYSKYAVLDYGKTLVNYLVYYDYTTHGKQLEDRNAAKYTPPFEPFEIAAITPVHVLHHTEE